MYQTLRYTVDKSWKTMMEHLDLNVTTVLREAGLTVELFERKTMSVTSAEYFRLWMAMTRLIESDRPAALLIGDSVSFEQFSPPLMAAVCSPEFETCVRRIQELKPLIGPLRIELEESDDEFSIRFESADPLIELHPLVIAGEFCFFTGLIRKATGEFVVPSRIVTKEAVEDVAYSEYFGTEPETGAVNRLSFFRKDTALPFKTENESLWNFFEPELRRRLEELETDAGFAARVRACLMELLPMGKSTIEDVAEKLGTSVRTLQRRLQKEETNYQKQLNHSRELLARHYLTNSELTSAEIAFLIGYDDPSSFSRAFHLWTGMTPESLRKTG